jgi:hypothetical protein
VGGLEPALRTTFCHPTGSGALMGDLPLCFGRGGNRGAHRAAAMKPETCMRWPGAGERAYLGRFSLPLPAATLGALPLSCVSRHGRRLDLEDEEDEALNWSHEGSSLEGWEELAAREEKGVAKGLRVNAGAGEATGGEDGAAGRPSGGRERGGGGVILTITFG